MTEQLQLQIHHRSAEPALIYLPGLHGDCTLIPAFRQALAGRARLGEFTYPRREDWSLDDYARAICARLAEHGVTRGWLIGESFSSQVAWAILRLANGQGRASGGTESFEPQGLILAGGFVRHPVPMGVRWACWTSRHVPMWTLRVLCNAWATWAQRRNHSSQEVTAGIREFVERRTNTLDRAALNSRYRLIAENDLRPIAGQTMLPVYYLSGAIDPIVPWIPVRRWLEKNCPGYRGSHIVRRAGHNVLLDAPAESADRILGWIAGAGGPVITPQAVTSSTMSAS